MRVFTRFFVWIFILLTLLLVGTYIYININGKRILTEQLTEAFKKPVSIGNVRLAFPVGLRIDDLNIEGLIQSKEVRFQIGFFSFLEHYAHISSLSLIEPQIVLLKNSTSGITLGQVSQNGDPVIQSGDFNTEQLPPSPPLEDGEGPAKKKKMVDIVIDNFLVKKGQIKYVDQVSQNGFSLTVKEVDLFAKNIVIPAQPANTRFDLTARLFDSPMNLSGGSVEAGGTMNWHDKDMDAWLKVKDQNGQVALTSNLISRKNVMNVNGKLNMANLITKKEKVEGEAESLQDMIFEGLQSSGVAIGLDFSFKTKMDDFRLSEVAIKGSVDYQKDKKSVVEEFKNIGKQLEGIGKKLKENTEKEDGAPVPPVEDQPAATP